MVLTKEVAIIVKSKDKMLAPVSEDANLHVKLISPALQLPSSSDVVNSRSSEKPSSKISLPGAGATKERPAAVKVSDEVTAKWDEGDEEDENVDVGTLGKDGMVNFICALPAQGKTNISMQWEVSAPAKTNIYEL